MDANDTLAHATLGDSLNAACYAIAGAVIHGSLALAVEIPAILDFGHVEEHIPGQVFNLAVNSGWLPRPDEPEEDYGVVLGDFYVKEEYRAWFIGLLDGTLSRLREVASKNAADEDAQRMQKGMQDVLLTYSLREAAHQLREETSPLPSETTGTVLPSWAQSFKAAQVVGTSTDERKALEEKYLSTNPHPVYGGRYEMQELHWMAGVHRKQWDRWRQGKIANNSEPGRRILALLERNQPARSSKSLKPRKREKLAL
jgi:hypothetical protein